MLCLYALQAAIFFTRPWVSTSCTGCDRPSDTPATARQWRVCTSQAQARTQVRQCAAGPPALVCGTCSSSMPHPHILVRLLFGCVCRRRCHGRGRPQRGTAGAAGRWHAAQGSLGCLVSAHSQVRVMVLPVAAKMCTTTAQGCARIDTEAARLLGLQNHKLVDVLTLVSNQLKANSLRKKSTCSPPVCQARDDVRTRCARRPCRCASLRQKPQSITARSRHWLRTRDASRRPQS